MKTVIQILLVCCGLYLASNAAAVEKISVLALFPDKAMVSIDGKNRVLARGESSIEGVELISATPHEAVVRFNGKEQVLRLGSSVAASYEKSSNTETRIVRDAQGYYMAQGSINGRSVQFLVDTGAGMVAMSEKEARRLNIPYRLSGVPARVTTASGETEAYGMLLKSVTVGPIELNNVQSVIIKGDYPPKVLLGMSFLNRLQIENNGNLMVLKQKH